MKNLTLDEITIYGEGGKKSSCFIAGTKISTLDGFKNIEDFVVGDSIVCYDEQLTTGSVNGSVVQVHKHPEDDVDCLIYTFTAGDYTLTVTGNHYIQTQYGGFEYAANFEVGDVLVDYQGVYRVIDSVSEREIGYNEYTYNLEVVPHHTYIANNIRVHNGGGGSSKSGSAPRPAQEAPNTLSSSSTVLVVEVLSEGEIVGLVDGAKSVYFDGTVVQNSDGTYNFDRVYIDQRTGTPGQSYMSGFPSVENPETVNIPIKYNINTYIRTVDAADVDGVRVAIVVESLYQQNKTNGDITGNTVYVATDVRLVGGTWVQADYRAITGKTMSSYEESWRVNRPNPGGTGLWQVRVRRLSADDVDSSYHSATHWSYMVNIKDKILPYPRTAYVGIKVDAKSTGGAVPRRSYRAKGIKVQVPTNYNPTTRVYTGAWNGLFKTEWTDNPAWIVYDLLTNGSVPDPQDPTWKGYGLGSFIDATMIDKFSFYDAAKYNDELVTVTDTVNGVTTTYTEPRFTFNAYINTRQEAWKLIQAVASSCRSVVYYGGGLIKMVQDRPVNLSTQLMAVINKTDVINGEFDYASTGIAQRHPVCQVSYNDKNDRYNPATVTVEDSDAVDRYGYNAKEIIAYGATTPGQARRQGLWTLYTELGTTESVKFSCGINLVNRLQPGGVVKIVDEDLMGVPYGGRTVSGTTTSITLDRGVTLATGEVYTLEWVGADGKTIRTRGITNPASPTAYTTLNFIGSTEAPTPGSSWVLTSQNIAGRYFRIYTITEVGPTQFDVTGFEYVHDKYTQVDQATNPETWAPIDPVFDLCAAPTNVTWIRETETDSYGRTIVNLRAQWEQPDSQYITNYMVAWRRDNRDTSSVMLTSAREFVIPAANAGRYELFIWAVNISNVKSKLTVGEYVNTFGSEDSDLSPVLDVMVQGGGTTWGGKDCTVTWTQNPANENQGEAIFKNYVVEVKNATQTVLYRTVEVLENSYTYNYDDNMVDTGGDPQRTLYFRVFNKDSYNNRSVPAFNTVTNPIPPTPTFTLTGGYQYYTVNITPSAADVVGYFVAEVATLNTLPTLADIVYDGPNPRIDIGYYDPSVIVVVGCYDMFNKDVASTNWAAAQTVFVTQAQEVVDSTEGYKFFSLEFKPNDPDPNKVSWLSSTVVKTNTTEQKSVPAGNVTWVDSAVYIYYDWATNVVQGSTNIVNAVGVGKAMLATYYGGKTLHHANGDAYIDGNKILAQTVGAAQIVAGAITANEIATGAITATKLKTDEAVITNVLQIESGLINGVHIHDGAITANEIATGAITATKLVTDSAVITNTAQIGNLIVTTGKIGDLQVSTLKIGDHAVTATQYYQYPTDIGFGGGDVEGSGVLVATLPYSGTGNQHWLSGHITSWIDNGFGLDNTRADYTKAFYYGTSAWFQIEITYVVGSTTYYALTERLDYGAAYGSGYPIVDTGGTTRWITGGPPKHAGTYQNTRLPLNTYPYNGTSGYKHTWSTVLDTVSGRDYTMRVYLKGTTYHGHVDGSATTNGPVRHTGYVLDQMYAITEIKK